jgi:lipopolysaccharide biosynthesis protein
MGNISPNIVATDDISLVRRSFLFDAEWYVQKYPDVGTSELDPAEHYSTIGWKLGYWPGPHFDPRRVVLPSKVNPLTHALRTLSLRNPASNRDSANNANVVFRPSPEPAFEEPGNYNSSHVGPAEVIQPSFYGAACRFEGTVAVHLHLYHSDMALYFRRWLDTIPVPFDLFVSVRDNSDVIFAEKEFSGMENVRRIVATAFPNVGRDLAPMIAGFGRRLMSYDLVLHMHSKKSDHTPGKRDWAAQMGHHLLGSRGHTCAMLELFADRPHLGLAFPVYHPSVRKQIRWGANFDTCQDLMARVGSSLSPEDLTPFPAGSFFAVRGEVLRVLLSGELGFEDFGPEAGQIDGTLAHGIERFFALLCRHLGYDSLQLRAARPFSMASAVLEDEAYISTKLQAFRSEKKPELPRRGVPAALRMAVFSGGHDAQPLPYEHLFSGTDYLFFQDEAKQEGEFDGHWKLQTLAENQGADWIPEAAVSLASQVDIAIWVAPNVSVVDDLGEHITQVLRERAACGIFARPYHSSLLAEINRCDQRHPGKGIAAKIETWVDHEHIPPFSDTDLIVFDLRRPEALTLLNTWARICRDLQGELSLERFAFDLACSQESISPALLDANGVGLRADPRLRIFQADSLHPYADVKPRLAQMAHVREAHPTPNQRRAMQLVMDVVLLVQPDDTADAVARTLQRLESQADARCRVILYYIASPSSAIQRVINAHLLRNPRDYVAENILNALQGEIVTIIYAGVLPADGWIDEMGNGVVSGTTDEVYAPLSLAGMDEEHGIWSPRLANELRQAAYLPSAPRDLIADTGSLPLSMHRSMAEALLSMSPSELWDRVRGLSPRVITTALMLIPSPLTEGSLPQTALDFLKTVVARHQTVQPTVAPIAFYLPQYHTFETNDELWGAGFSEWRNVVKARPRFPGHYQPRLPGDLGYYDLRSPNTLRAQGLLAEQHGIHGMACYYYRFGEQRLMNEPTDLLLSDGSIPLRFFYCWANEDWTKAWDGRSDEVNLKQDYSERTISMILDDLVRASADTRYIRVDGKPVFMLYQLNKLPNLRETLRTFREGLKSRLGVDICLGTTYNADFCPEWEELVDFIAQFPPHRTPRKEPRALLQGDSSPKVEDPLRGDFLESYENVRRQSLQAVDFLSRLQPGVCPDWDNSARRAQQAHILVGASPKAFGDWAHKAALATEAKMHTGKIKTPFLFINAWNEWAEGAVMEPYENDGRANLSAFSCNIPWHKL